MFLRLFKWLFPKEQDDWFRALNMATVLPILAWPLVLLLGIFMFDNPFQAKINVFFQWILVIIYPVYLVFIALTNRLLFGKNKILGTVSTLIFIVIILVGLAYLFQ